MKQFSIKNFIVKFLPNNWISKANLPLSELLNLLVWICLSFAIIGTIFGFTNNSLIGTGFVKQSVFIISVNVAFLCWILSQLYNKHFSVKWNSSYVLAVLFVVIVGVSALLSEYLWGSFVGTTVSTINVLSVWSLVAFAFLLGQRDADEINYWLKLFLYSTGVLLLISFVQFVGWYVFPNASTHTAAFTPFGTIRIFGLLVALLLPVWFSVYAETSGIKKLLSIVLTVFIFIFLQIVLSSLAWWVVVAGSFAWLSIRYFANQNTNFKGRNLVLVGLIFALVMCLWPIKNLVGVALPVNVRLTNALSYTIAADSATSSIKEFALGSGPSTFAQVYMQKRPLQLNSASLVRGDQTVQLWNVRFVQPSNAMALMLVTVGVLGTLGFIALLVWVLLAAWQIVKYEPNDTLTHGLFAMIATVLVTSFFQSYSLPIFVLIFFMIGLLNIKNIKSIEWPVKLSINGILFIILALIVTAASLGVTVVQGKRVLANYFAAQSIKSRSAGYYEQAVNEAGKAVQLVPQEDVLTRLLVDSWLSYAIDLSNQQSVDTQKLQTAVLATIQASARAEQIDPTNGRNVASLAFVFRQVAPFFDGAGNLSVETYKRAEALEPTNPALPLERAKSLLVVAQYPERNITKEENRELSEADINKFKEDKIEEAKKALYEAVSLKSDYAEARFLLANIAIQQNSVASAIQELNQLQTTNLNDAGLYYQRGILYYSQKDYESAKQILEQAVKINPGFANARYFLGLTFAQLGDYEAAIAQFEEVKKLDEKSADTINPILNNLRLGRDPLTNVNTVNNSDQPIEEPSQ